MLTFVLKFKRQVTATYGHLTQNFTITSQSVEAEDNPEKVARFNKEAQYMVEKWDTKRQSDKFYNGNLTCTKEDFSLRLPSGN